MNAIKEAIRITVKKHVPNAVATSQWVQNYGFDPLDL